MMGSIISKVICVLIILFIFFPFLWMINLSFMPNTEIFSSPPNFFNNITTEHYLSVLTEEDFLFGIKNSIILATFCTAVTLLLSSTAAYSLSRFHTKIGSVFSAMILFSRMIPSIVIGIPIYYISYKLNLLNTLIVPILAISSFTVPLQIWFLTDFSNKVPRSLDEAALIDGCNRFSIFSKIVLPLTRPGLASSAILTFLFAWNNLFFVLILTQKDTKTGVMALMDFLGYRVADWGAIMAGGVLLMLPSILIGILCTRYIISGIVSGAVKG